MRLNYKFVNPLKMHTSTDVEEIKEINIDLDELTIKDLVEIEKRYNKIIDGSSAPIIQRDYTSCYHTAVLEIILKKPVSKIFNNLQRCRKYKRSRCSQSPI